MAASGHFGCPKFTFDRISGHLRSVQNFFLFFEIFDKCRWPFWMYENHIRLHFWPFQIDTELAAILDVRNSFSVAFLAISDQYKTFFISLKFLTKCPKFTDQFRSIQNSFLSIVEFVRDIWMSNACVKSEERSLNPSKVIALTTKLWWGSCGADENTCIIIPKTCVSREYDYDGNIWNCEKQW